MTEAIEVAVIGATGRLGRKVTARLVAKGCRVRAIGRSEILLDGLGGVGERAVADCTDGAALAGVLAGAAKVASCVHARFAPAILAALPPELDRLVLMGSTRRFSRFPDKAAGEVAAAEAALAASGRPGVILHPTMIYGAAGENNVQRIAALIRRFGVIALPKGGTCLIQPIHVEDVASCVEAALFAEAAPGPPIVLAGPRAVSLAAFVKAIAAAMGRNVVVLPAPATLLYGGAVLLRLVPGAPKIRFAEIRRLLEDKDFPIAGMKDRLGIVPRSLEAGLSELFGQSPQSL